MQDASSDLLAPSIPLADLMPLRSAEALMLRLFPNPTQNILQLQLPAGLGNNAVIHITDLQGKLIHQQELSSGAVVQVNVQSWNKGMYILTLRDHEHTWHQRWIKE